MFTPATEKFGVWKREKKENKMIYYFSSIHFLFSLSILAFIVFIMFIVTVKIRQEFFLIESAPISLFKDNNIESSFLVKERASAINIFIKKKKNNILHIYFDDGYSFLIPNESKSFIEYLEKRKKNIIYLSMILRVNDLRNSRVKVYPEKDISFADIRMVMKIFSIYGFDNFDIGVER